MERNIDDVFRARQVLPANGWSLPGGIQGRQFELDDLDQLVELGSGDASFVWERAAQPRDYFRNLIQFRTRHYENYGFGVHGVWLGGNLIGQFGLQVYDEVQRSVEVVVFLGQEYVGQGYGTILMDFLIAQAQHAKLECFYGIVRDENNAGKRLMSKYGGAPLKKVEHFGQLATVYRVGVSADLERN